MAVAEVDNLDPFSRQEPWPPIASLCDPGVVGASRDGAELDAVRCIPHGTFDRALRSAIRASSSVRLIPTRPQPVYDQDEDGRINRPVDCVARQTISGCERGDAAILEPAEAAFSVAARSAPSR